MKTSWTVDIELQEDGDHTRADAITTIGARRYHGWGRARRNPVDPDVPKIGEELAAARALSDLAHQLLNAAVDDIEAFEGRPTVVHG
jgi:hypothetical protein